MLADGGLGIGKDIDNFSADTGIDINEMLNDFHPCRMPQGFKNFCKLFSGHFYTPFIIVYRLLTIDYHEALVNRKILIKVFFTLFNPLDMVEICF
jgi:hypothetical protein